MGKKRDRRVGLSAERLSERVESSRGEDKNVDSVDRHANQNRKLTTTIFVLLFILAPVISVIIYDRVQAPSAGANRNVPYVYERGLVKTDINYLDILTEHMKVSENVSQRQFQNPVLAYITPWNSKGYDLAKKFHSKLTHISPVWYDLKSQGSKLILEGRHNADTGWISELRMKGNIKVVFAPFEDRTEVLQKITSQVIFCLLDGPNTKPPGTCMQILPRVVLEAIPMDFLKKKKQRDKAINIIIAECQEMDYDGIVLESWSRWAAYGILHDPEMRIKALQFIKQLGEAMHSVSLERKNQQTLELVYVIGPPYSDKLQQHDFGPEDLRDLGHIVDGFSLMTYDFSVPHNPGPNAPIKWIHSTLKTLLGANKDGQGLAEKIFVGINFYGNDFELSGGMGGGPILGTEYLSLLEQHRPVMQWEKNSAEHFFLYSNDKDIKHVVFYPSLMSIAVRLEEVRSWGAGISIWEIGQGLDYFFDIL